MKLSVAAIVALAASYVAAQDPAALTRLGFPTCAIDCIVGGNKKAGCANQDSKCQCGEKATQAVAECLKKDSNCTEADLAQLSRIGNSTCSNAGAGGPPSAGGGKKDGNSTVKANTAVREMAASGLLGLIGFAAFAGL